jgi:hypothetical protein
LEPYVVDGAVPAVLHAVAAPAAGATVGNGLTPGEVISLAPSGTPVPPTPLRSPVPGGKVAPTVVVGAAIPATCAIAALLAKNGAQAVMSEIFICISDLSRCAGKRCRARACMATDRGDEVRIGAMSS